MVGLGAWLLGAVTATSGSMIAVNELAHGLLDAQAQAQQLGGKPVSADLEPSAGKSDESPAASAAPAKHARTPATNVPPAADPRSNRGSTGPGAQNPDGQSSTQGPGGGSSTQSPPPSGSSSQGPGTLLVSSGGSVTATCESAGAYLLYWTPNQGYEAEDVYRGPAATASVTFRASPTVSVVMRVSCSGVTPVAHVYSGRDE